MPLVGQDMNNVVVNLAISESPGILMNVGMRVIRACEVSSYRYDKVYYCNAMILIVVMWTSFRVFGLKVSSVPDFAV